MEAERPFERVDTQVKVYESTFEPGVWVVLQWDGEAAENEVVFYGPRARVLAFEYAAAKYTSFRRGRSYEALSADPDVIVIHPDPRPPE